jgi:hypothetical protein
MPNAAPAAVRFTRHEGSIELPIADCRLPIAGWRLPVGD